VSATETSAPGAPANLSRAALLARYEGIFESVSPPFAFVDLDALQANGRFMLAQGAGKPIRVASKSVRSVALLRRILELDPGFRGILAYTLPEALWLMGQGFEDIVVAYPTTDREALAELVEVSGDDAERAPMPMVDSPPHLDLIEAAIHGGASQVRVCLDLDLGWWPGGGKLARIGPKRSPVRTPEAARRMAAEISERPGTRLAGVMAYEGHIAGVGDRIPGRPLRSAAIRVMQAASERDIRRRLPRLVAAVGELAELEFVNGGGTGSLARTAAGSAVTELTAGSGFYAPALFDNYRSLELTPAAFFALPVVRRPSATTVTALGGGYPASGAPAPDRLPTPYLPEGLHFDRQEGAGEVQTPLRGVGSRRLRIGDRVYLRHAKAGELCERFGSLYLVQGDRIADQVSTYRGEGKSFL
jgi:D-serine deaminase-like pyridoxal phosphate-dependent protein